MKWTKKRREEFSKATSKRMKKYWKQRKKHNKDAVDYSVYSPKVAKRLKLIAQEVKEANADDIYLKHVGRTWMKESTDCAHGKKVELIYTDKYILGIEEDKTVHFIANRQTKGEI